MRVEDILVENLGENKYFNCEKVFIRGSYALNIQNEYSDLDIIVVSSDFSGLDIITRKKLLQKSFDVKLKLKVDAICLTLDEFMCIFKDFKDILEIDELYEVIL
ncbi:nucleotidyltransferase domain-containing protein [Brassicibacter mesophilus]|uniref:nucleotidyltransferase domain-containing protein n=1 Tax=Brassicibacter mesophilus TaxID=745119 RepID=UPI003D2322F3